MTDKETLTTRISPDIADAVDITIDDGLAKSGGVMGSYGIDVSTGDISGIDPPDSDNSCFKDGLSGAEYNVAIGKNTCVLMMDFRKTIN